VALVTTLLGEELQVEFQAIRLDIVANPVWNPPVEAILLRLAWLKTSILAVNTAGTAGHLEAVVMEVARIEILRHLSGASSRFSPVKKSHADQVSR
jgi:hypothetical protein